MGRPIASGTDEAFMQQALDLAARGRGRTSPNPAVGCVIVRDGEIVGQGWHERAGHAHAEAAALRDAGERARGATAYVTLEPCAHHGRTPPCTDALIAAGIARVVAAHTDPNPQVAGRGLAALQAAGIAVTTGVLAQAAMALNEPYIHWVQTGRPFVWWKAAVSLDGKIATRTGDSRWITGEPARAHGHRLRNELDAIMVGVGTVLADDPQLTCRLPGGRDPVAIVCDSHARTPPSARLFDRSSPVLVAVTPAAPSERVAALQQRGAEILVIPPDDDGRVSLPHLLTELGRRPLTSVLLEGGADLAASALAAGLVDKAWLFVAPKVIGGATAPGPVGGHGIAALADAAQWRFADAKRIGDDMLLEAYPVTKGAIRSVYRSD